MSKVEIRKSCTYDESKHFCSEDLKKFQVEVVPGLLEDDFLCFTGTKDKVMTVICEGTPKEYDPTAGPGYTANKFGAQADFSVAGSLLKKGDSLYGGVGGSILLALPMNFMIHKYGDLISPVYQALFSVGPEIGVNTTYGVSDKDTSSIDFMAGLRHTMVGNKNVGYKLSFGYIMDRLMFEDTKEHGIYLGLDLLYSKIAGRRVNKAAFTWGAGALLAYFPKEKDIDSMLRTFVGFLY